MSKNKKLAILLIVLVIASTAIAAKAKSRKQKTYGDFQVAKIISVYDGDTFRCDLKGDYPDIIGKNISIRINGIDTPELRDKRPKIKARALAARDFARKKLNNAKKITLKNTKRGKYFRIVADIYCDDINLGKLLINTGHAKNYNGKKKTPW